MFVRSWAALFGAAVLFCGPAVAQSHETTAAGYVLRSSSVQSQRINADAARKYGIEPAADRAVLNVVVLEAGPAQTTSPAKVSASRSNLAGMVQTVPLREVREGNRVSYIGDYTFLPKEVIRFRIEAEPAGHTGDPLLLEYEERMGATRR